MVYHVDTYTQRQMFPEAGEPVQVKTCEQAREVRRKGAREGKAWKEGFKVKEGY